MGKNVQARGGRHQLRVTHKLLPKPFFFTFDSEHEAHEYGDILLDSLKKGVVPHALLTQKRETADQPMAEVIRQYTQLAPVTDSDNELLDVVLAEVAGLRVSDLGYAWVEAYVRRLKLERNLAPGTIRKRVGVLARVLDWHARRATPGDKQSPVNPFRALPRGYSSYTRAEAERLAEAGKDAKRDVARDRRLSPDEEARVRQALAGVKREDRERALTVEPAFTLLFELILHTGMRLLEAYRLRVDQIDFAQRVIMVEGSKGHRGAIKPRVTPIKPHLLEMLRARCQEVDGLVFPWWDGQHQSQVRISNRLSQRFRGLFEYAMVPDFTEHDLRHDATCRWILMRRPDGHWAYSDAQICRIMGWTSTRMLLRYASLRGGDLADCMG